MQTKAPFLEVIREGRFLLDGGMGSALLATGQVAADEVALASVRHPELVSRIHRGFLEAGSQWVQSNSFAANALALGTDESRPSVSELNQRAAELALEAARDFGGTYVAGNLGPAALWCAADAVPGDVELASVYREQGEALALAGVDLFSLETFGGSAEACLAIRALRSLADLPIVACLTFVRRAAGFETLRGEPIFAALQQLLDAGADLVGVNCAGGSAEMLELVRARPRGCVLPMIAKPNAGMPEPGEHPAVYGQAPEDFASDVREMLECGVLAVGGCCGADERFIAALRRAL